ncbi:MAG: isoleucine--tRNA ligase [Firmicutes bacterium]|nr:isoleucine--tRNA ligase [Alicyclobacillaceae bacterium]MCL6496505.1 isoleucine--tRNA ligase [Bacillota bacterium]
MRANLPQREPEQVARWQAHDLYQRLREARRGRPRFVLHDGPPYANGDIHTGTALNKIVKDMINRYWAIRGYDVPFVPGWDTHGLPIETRALKELGVTQHEIAPLELRRACRAVAERYIAAMTREFQRLGILGDWDHPYITLDPEFEAAELEVFADMVDKGLVYRDQMPVYWCPHCETALAEGEIEYHDHRSPAIYVGFILVDGQARGLPLETRAVIWTTTPWTLPANLAIAVHPDLEYVAVKTAVGPLLVAAARVEAALGDMQLPYEVLPGRWTGRELEGLQARHPYLDRTVPLILGEHVTADSGTGLVHTAPGHGVEDWVVGKRYQVGMLQPLDNRGRFVADTPLVGGLFYEDANPVIVERLRETGALLGYRSLVHAYPFCWRCKNPVVYRATDQWFLSVDRIRDQLEAATRSVSWDPEWGGDRMRSMVVNRQDWCLSRQRVWGVPIPAFYCEGCGAAILEARLVRRVAEKVRQRGSDVWWQEPAAFFLPPGFRCPQCGGKQFRQERDIFDVWMDSGSTHAAVLLQRPELTWPADLVLEGADQFRGWFNSLLTTGVAMRGRAPYRGVLTHGWVLDREGREMHKSLGNTVDPLELVERWGADVLRLWVASSDFRSDVRISDELMGQLAETYRKLRNTFRFLLGNLSDFDPERDRVAEVRDAINRWAVDLGNRWLEEADAAYRHYQFHLVHHHTQRLVTVELSSIYLDVIKDRLYTLAKNDPLRRETQSVLYHLLTALTIGLSPILAFTAEEVYQTMPRPAGSPPSVHLAEWPAAWAVGYTDRERKAMAELLQAREVVLKALEQLRQRGEIGNSLEAEVRLGWPQTLAWPDAQQVAVLTELCLVAAITVEPAPGWMAAAAKTKSARCQRCWRHLPEVGRDPQAPDLCARCQSVLLQLDGV